MQNKNNQKFFVALLEMEGGGTREVKVKASSSEVAGRRALKRVERAVAVRQVVKGVA